MEGCTMGQVLHGSATTTEAIRRTIQHSQASLRALAQRYGINPKTVAKSENRGRYDRTTTAGVRLDEGKPPSSSLACPSRLAVLAVTGPAATESRCRGAPRAGRSPPTERES